MPSLILEGGTLRPIFSAGVMDALLDNNLTFPYCIGVSAGITNGVSYISKQKGRNLEVVTKYRNDNRYLSYRNFLRCKSIFGLDFVFDEIPNNLIPFDMNTYRKYPGKVLVGVTNAHTGKTEYLNGKIGIVDSRKHGIPVRLQVGITRQQREIRELERFSCSRLIIPSSCIIRTFFRISSTSFAHTRTRPQRHIGPIYGTFHVIFC